MPADLIPPGLSRDEMLELLTLQEEKLRRIQGNQLAAYRPYPKQREHHNKGALFRERLLRAGNQLGKTWCAGFETAMHLTGRYPNWWGGKVFNHPVAGWAASVTNEGTRDTVQRIMLGRWAAKGTGAIPRDAIKSMTLKRGVADAIDTIIVRHGGGGDVQAGESLIAFKSYEQGREKFQGETLHFVWFDEEPPLEIYTEGLTRTNTTRGIVYLTFTPLQGMSDVVKRFMMEPDAGRTETVMTIHDAEHYTPAERESIIAAYPAHERKARSMGIPTLGSGRIFPIDEELLKVDAIEIPRHWVRIAGIDFGWDHPSAAVEIAWDRETDIVYVTKCHRQKEQTPLLFAATVKPWGDWLPWAWPHDGLQHDKGSGQALRDQYAAQGLNMLPDKATHPPPEGEEEGKGGNGVEAGVLDLLDRMQTGRFKVFSHLADWFEEFRMYHRKDGKIVKLDDDLMSATRYANMMKRFACSKPAPSKPIDVRSRMLA